MRPTVLFNVAVFAVIGRPVGFNRLTAVNSRLDCVNNLFAVCTFNSDFFRLGKVEFVAFFVRNRNTCDTYVKLNIRSICALGERNADFLRTLVDRKLIPDDVEVQVLVQCREHLIKRTFEALKGIKKAIVHIYNSTSTLQRDVVFHKDMDEIKDIAIVGTKMVQRYAAECDTKIRLEYSPESFTGTELDFALDICTAVQETWGATKENPIIINLPSTVEMNTPNVYADPIEWMNCQI